MKKQLVSLILAAIFLLATMAAFAQEKKPAPTIQLALLLDTSNSMDGLIDQAKTQLWKVVNEFATMKKDGLPPVLNVALYEYGNDFLSFETGFIRQVLPLTDDLDAVSRELFALKTNGGNEFCGQVIHKAVEQLKWSGSPDDLKMIVIAGNEPFTQGTVDYRKSCPQAIAKGIIVNTIFCGDYNQGVTTQWKDGATLADGKYMNINQDMKIEHIPAPQDAEIERLGAEINKTYLPYGSRGAEAYENQAAQDANAKSSGIGSFLARSVTKSNAQYRNESWDLVDAVRDNNVKLDDVKEADLPEDMRKMTPEERKDFVAKKQSEREALQGQIQKLNSERDKFVADEMKKKAGKQDETLDQALISTIREQAGKKNYSEEK
jgi:hypothetical protein